MTTIDTFVNRVIHGDCIQVMRAMPDNSVDLVVTDPPYLVRYRSRDGRGFANDDNTRWLKPAFAEMHRVLKPDSFCVSFYGWNRVEYFTRAWRDAGFTPVSHLVWVKPYHSRKGFTRAHHEAAYLLAKGNPPVPQEAPRDVLDWVYTENRLHPTQKPVLALTPLILAYSRPGGIVLDPFAGSGTTADAAKQAGRSYVAIEKVWQYYRAAHQRLTPQTSQLARAEASHAQAV